MTNQICVIGLGKMGLSAAVYYAEKGAHVSGIDIDHRVVAAVNEARNPIGPEPGVVEHLAEVVASGRLVATASYRAGLAEAEVVIVLVPLTAFGGSPDFGNLDAVIEALGDSLEPGALVVFETTLPVGTTRRRFAPRLRERNPDLLIAFSPERVSSGAVFEGLDSFPKIVGGVDDASLEAAVSFYRKYLPSEVVAAESAELAEMTKLAEATYRDVNIAYANELARMCDEWGLDVSAVIRGANSQPYSHIHAPGVGVGGHCIPHYPHLLLDSTSGSALVREARRINDDMPRWVIDRAENELAGTLAGQTVVALGVAYRPGVPEIASSPTFDLDRECARRGVDLLVADPMFTKTEIERMGLTPWAGETPDVIVLVTAHEEYLDFDLLDYPPLLVVDGRNVWDRHAVELAGHRYLGVGR